MNCRIEPLESGDWPAVRAILLEGIATGQATFETDAPDWATWDAGHLATCRHVARAGGPGGTGPSGVHAGSAILGWTALSRVSGRCVYGGVAEVSVYVAAAARGQGVGGGLLRALVTSSEAAGLWTLQAGVFEGNVASLALHLACGFRIVGTRERLGRMAGGQWRNVVLLERRSASVGLDDAAPTACPA